MSVNPDEPQYVGRPTPEMDKAWENLIARERYYLALGLLMLTIFQSDILGLRMMRPCHSAARNFGGANLTVHTGQRKCFRHSEHMTWLILQDTGPTFSILYTVW
jgi:hypothetical protein